ncbi:MAG TPA: hypothetical protein EYQ74_05660 [Planctomycetes bacterium]|nr:hypothetical protein [Planctomycetota bacterium]HIK61365.1 hypothetical protein [Planctomycetota bacterium]
MLWAVGGAWLAGAYLRLWQLGQQIVVGDEVHALKSAGSGTVGTILTLNGLPDKSIPMALWDHLLIQTVGLSEWGLRFPVLLAGLLALAILTVFAWRQISPLAGVLVAWLAALSPQMVMFSRFARPYMPIMLLSLLTVVFWQQQLAGKRRRGWYAIISTLFAISLSPTCAPALAAANGCGLLLLIKQDGWSALRPPRSLHKGRVLGPVLIAVVTAVLIAGLAQALRMLPEARNFMLRTRWKGTPVDWPVVLEYISFTQHQGLRIWFGISLIIGLLSPRPGVRALGFTLTVMAVVQVGCIVLFVPWGGRAFSIMRYLLVLYPLALLLTATGIDLQISLIRRVLGGKARWGGLWAPAALITIAASVLNTGPLPNLYQASNSFTGMWPERVTPLPNFAHTAYPAVPTFYRFLAETNDDLTIIEAPSISTSPASLMHYARHQEMHHQRVVLLNRRPAYQGKSEGINLTSIRRLKPSGGHGLKGIDYIIVHRDFIEERRAMLSLGEDTSRNPLVGTKTERELAKKAAQLIEEFDGDNAYLPVFRNELVAIFALAPGALEAFRDWDSGRH